jgi:hypothetical protein
MVAQDTDGGDALVAFRINQFNRTRRQTFVDVPCQLLFLVRIACHHDASTASYISSMAIFVRQIVVVLSDALLMGEHGVAEMAAMVLSDTLPSIITHNYQLFIQLLSDGFWDGFLGGVVGLSDSRMASFAGVIAKLIGVANIYDAIKSSSKPAVVRHGIGVFTKLVHRYRCAPTFEEKRWLCAAVTDLLELAPDLFTDSITGSFHVWGVLMISR